MYSVYWCLKLHDIILINHDSGTSWCHVMIWCHDVILTSVLVQLALTTVFMNCINTVYLITSYADDYVTCIWLRHMQIITAYADDDICRWLHLLNALLHYITLHYITLHYITLHYITLHYITLHHITLHYITLHGMQKLLYEGNEILLSK